MEYFHVLKIRFCWKDTKVLGARKDAEARSFLVILPQRHEGAKCFGGLDTKLEGAREDAEARRYL